MIQPSLRQALRAVLLVFVSGLVIVMPYAVTFAQTPEPGSIRGLYFTEREQVTPSSDALLVYSSRPCKDLVDVIGAGQWQLTETYLSGRFQLEKPVVSGGDDDNEDDPTSTPRPSNTPRPSTTPKPSATPRPNVTAKPTATPTATKPPTSTPIPLPSATPYPTSTPLPPDSFVHYSLVLRQSEAALFADLQGTTDCAARIVKIPQVTLSITGKDSASSYNGPAYLFAVCIQTSKKDRKTKQAIPLVEVSAVWGLPNGTRYAYEFESEPKTGEAVNIVAPDPSYDQLRVSQAPELYPVVQGMLRVSDGATLPVRLPRSAIYIPKDRKVASGTVQYDALQPAVHGKLTIPAFVAAVGNAPLSLTSEIVCTVNLKIEINVTGK